METTEPASPAASRDTEAELRDTLVDLNKALATLHDFRLFVLRNATQWKLGGWSGNPMWLRVAEELNAHGMNDPEQKGAHGYIQGDPAYYCD